MRSSVFTLATIFLGLVVAQSDTVPVTGKSGDAVLVSSNPSGLIYTATLPEQPFAKLESNIKGSVSGIASGKGIGVIFTVDFSNLPKSGGPFLYHIHEAPVPSDGNCTGTLGHLDPYNRGESTPCDAVLPQTCQVGDLSGKHGAIPLDTDTFHAVYNDSTVSSVQGDPAFFGNRSITLHFANKTRITCANFMLASGSNGQVSLSSSASSSRTSTYTSTLGQTKTTTTTTASAPSGGNETAHGTSTGTATGTLSTAAATTSAPSQFPTASASSVQPALYAALFGVAIMAAWMI